MQRLSNKKTILHNSDGAAVVEATFVFPIMFMVFFVLVMLAFYLPQRAMLQQATQTAASTLAVEMSDTWIYYDSGSQACGRYASHDALSAPGAKGGVYVTLFRSVFSGGDAAEMIVEDLDRKENIPIIANGELTVECEVVNYIVYKEVVVTATRSIPVPVNLSIIQFPRTIDLIVTSRAVVQNGDEFIRNVDIAIDFTEWLNQEFPGAFGPINAIFDKVEEAGVRMSSFFGIDEEGGMA